MILSEKRKQEIMTEYISRKFFSEQRFQRYKDKINCARDAYKQIAPADILNSIIATPESGNGGEKRKDQFSGENNSSTMIHPMFAAICNKMIESLHALPPRYEWAANTNDGISTAWALELELMKCYTKSNIGAKIPLLIWHLVVDGIFAQQTIYKKMEEKIRVNGKEEVIYNGGTIDFIVYDPIDCYFDWDADITDMRKTSKYFIATINPSITLDGLKARFGKEAVEKAQANGLSSMKSGDRGDQLKRQQQVQDGLQPPEDSYIYREYYTNDGMCYHIINDNYIIEAGYVESGVADQIPINIGVCYINPDNPLGMTLWEKVKWCIAQMSQAINQVADRNAFNNNAPFFMLGSIDKNYSRDKSTGRKIIKLIPFGNNQDDVRKMISQFLLPEVLPGAQWMFQEGLQGLFYVTGTNSMSFGIQDKQIRTEDVANMIGASLVRSDSDIAKKIECSFFNPVTWDFLRIFYVNYDSFGFDKNQIPREFLKNYKDIRVVNGSYLTADRVERLGKLTQVLQLAAGMPEIMRMQALFHDLIQAIGFINPALYLKSGNEVMIEEIMNDIALKAAQGILSDEELKAAAACAKEIAAISQKSDFEAGGAK